MGMGVGEGLGEWWVGKALRFWWSGDGGWTWWLMAQDEWG